MYVLLRRLRIWFSALFAVVLTYAIADSAFGATAFGRWIAQVELVPAILAGAAIWIVLWVLVTITFGRVYCSSVCPLGTMQDASAHLGRTWSKGAGKRYSYHAPNNGLRIPIPLIVAACFFAGITSAVELTDPYAVYGRMVKAACHPAAIGAWSVILAAILFFLINFLAYKRGRLVCNTLCPAGGLLGLLSRTPVYRIDINTDKCIHCNKCEDVCKSECIDMANCTVDNSRCVMCFNCTAVCPNEAIVLRRGRYRLSTPMMINAAQCATKATMQQPQNCAKQ